MALQIANPNVVSKIHELARITGMTKTAAVEKAVDEMLKSNQGSDTTQERERMFALLNQFDRVPLEPSPSKDITWDQHGLPT
jgi:antitoxin VapB